MTTSPQSAAATTPARSHRWTLARHFLEMLVAMAAGMVVLGTARALLGLTVTLDDRPGVWYLLMATDMAIGMAVWMRVRGHAWAGTLEMCAAMYVPIVLVPLVWADAMAPSTFMLATHVAMVLAMLAVLLRRRDEYAHC
jgi:hypothetical protein